METDGLKTVGVGHSVWWLFGIQVAIAVGVIVGVVVLA